MYIVKSEQVSRALVGTAGTGVGEVTEAVIRDGTIPLLRVLGTHQVVFVESMVDLDVELVVGVSAGPEVIQLR